MITGEAAAFYHNHRGGSGAVVLAIAINSRTGDTHQHAIFSDIELAQAWSNRLGDDFVCVFSPYIVDDPDWGNEADTVLR